MSEEQNNELQKQPKKEYEPPGKRSIQIKLFPLVMLIFGLVVITATITLLVLTTGEEKVVNVVSPTQPSVERKEFKKLYDAYDEMKKNYYADINEQEVIDGAINGMIEALGDPYSDYLSQEEAQKLHENIASSFEGIGAEIQELNGYISVVSPIKNSPAERAGILPNDLIVAVNGDSIQGMSSSEAVLLIRGEKGSTVTLSIRRGSSSETFDVKIVRDVIPIETVYAEMLEDGVGHVHITNFSDNTTAELLTALEELEQKGMKALVVDVRQNPGGTLKAAMDISSLFVENGKNILQYAEKGKPVENYTSESSVKITVPIAVLIDDGSASASEILAAALKESASVPLVGINSFGKGTVQSPKDLADGSNIKLTTAKWLTPNGNWIHEKGIAPDIEVPYPSYAMLPFIDPAEEMQVGMISPSIKVAEEMFEVLGYDPGKVDGLFDEETAAAVKALQQDLSIEETGILAGDTTYGLMNKLRDKIKKDDPQLLKAKEVLMEQLNK